MEWNIHNHTSTSTNSATTSSTTIHNDNPSSANSPQQPQTNKYTAAKTQRKVGQKTDKQHPKQTTAATENKHPQPPKTPPPFPVIPTNLEIRGWFSALCLLSRSVGSDSFRTVVFRWILGGGFCCRSLRVVGVGHVRGRGCEFLLFVAHFLKKIREWAKKNLFQIERRCAR